MPSWAQHPDREYLDAMERLRRRYQWHMDCKPILLNDGYGDSVLTMEVMLAVAERMAADLLA